MRGPSAVDEPRDVPSTRSERKLGVPHRPTQHGRVRADEIPRGGPRALRGTGEFRPCLRSIHWLAPTRVRPRCVHRRLRAVRRRPGVPLEDRLTRAGHRRHRLAPEPYRPH